MEYFIHNKIRHLLKNHRNLRELSATSGITETLAGSLLRDPSARYVLTSLGVAVVRGHCNKPLRKMADDPAASGP